MSHILFIESDPALARLVGDHLGAAGHNVKTVSDGHSAIAGLITFHPDLVLLEVELPDGVGYALCGLLRRLNATARIPVVLIGEGRDPAMGRRALEAGGDAFITKPFHPSDLVARIEAQLVIAAHFRREHRPLNPELAGVIR